MINSCLVLYIVSQREIGALNLFTTANQCYVKLRACVSHLGSVLGIEPKKQQLNRLKKSLALYRHCSPTSAWTGRFLTFCTIFRSAYLSARLMKF